LARNQPRDRASFTHGVNMTEKLIETPKAKSDDSIELKTNAGKTEGAELSKHELEKVSGGSGKSNSVDFINFC
jgi:bacteriocin-like protein